MNRHLLFFLLLLAPMLCGAARLKADYGDYAVRKFYIGWYQEGSWQLLDSAFVNVSGQFTAQIPDNIRGMIMIVGGDSVKPSDPFVAATSENSLQFVYEGQDISYTTSWRSNGGYLKYGQGCEATAALKELNARLNKVQERIYYIEKLLSETAMNTTFSKALYKEFSAAVKHYNSFCDSTSKLFSNNKFMALYAGMFRQVCPPQGTATDSIAVWTAKHLFDYTDLHNPLTADVPLLKGMLKYYLYLNQPEGIAQQSEIERMQKEAKERLSTQCAENVKKVILMNE